MGRCVAHELRLHRRGGDRLEADEPGEAALGDGGLPAEDDRGSAVVDARGIAGGDRAVLGEGRAEAGQGLESGVGLGVLVLVGGEGLAAPDLEGGDLLGEGCLRLGGRRAALRLEGELVLLLAGDAVLLRDVFRRDAHVDAVEGVGEHEDGAVLQLAVAELVAAAGTEVVEGHPGHRLVAAGEGEVEVVPPHLHRGGPDRLQARAAQAVDRVGGDVGRQAGRDGDATRVVGVGADLADAAHDDLGDVLARDTGALQRHPAGLGAELEARHVLEHPAEASGRGTGAVDDDDLLGAHQLLRGRWVRSEVSIPPRPSRSLRRSPRDRLEGRS